MIFNSQFFEPITYATFIVYGAASETVTFTGNGKTYTIKTASNGVSSTSLEVITGTYTVTGSVSGYSGSQTITTSTTRVNAWPSNYNIYYWYGYAPNGGWSRAAALPTASPYDDNPVTPTLSVSTNSVYMKTSGDYARGGSIYLPKAKLSGTTLYLKCSGATNKSWLALNVTSSMSNYHTSAGYATINTGDTSKTLNISSLSGGSYYIAISANTSGYSTGSKPSSITVHAVYTY